MGFRIFTKLHQAKWKQIYTGIINIRGRGHILSVVGVWINFELSQNRAEWHKKIMCDRVKFTRTLVTTTNNRLNSYSEFIFTVPTISFVYFGEKERQRWRKRERRKKRNNFPQFVVVVNGWHSRVPYTLYYIYRINDHIERSFFFSCALNFDCPNG